MCAVMTTNDGMHVTPALALAVSSVKQGSSLELWSGEIQSAKFVHLVVQVLMYAQLRGNSQSLVKVVSGGLPRNASCQPPVVEHETSASARVNGRGSFGMIVMDAAVSIALDKAAAGGIAVVGTHGTASGTGALG